MDDQRNDRDPELDALLGPLRKQGPGAEQMAAWRNAVQAARGSRRSARNWFGIASYSQLVAALLLGFVIGALSFRSSPAPRSAGVAEQSEPSATIERVYAKAD